MALKGSKGLKYFPLVTDFFQDRDVRRLMLTCGEQGVLLYIYILCAIYGKSYYLKWDEDMLMDASIDLRCETRILEEALSYMLEKGFFDRELYRQRGLLSSRAVQRQFQECARAMRRRCLVDKQAWLLEDEETCQYVLFEQSKNVRDEGNTVKVKGDSDIDCQISSQKKGKEKEKKLKETKGEPRPAQPEGLPQTEGYESDKGTELESLVHHYRERLDLGGRGEQELKEYAQALGQELCSHALDRAIEQDKPHWSYVRAILRSYRQRGYCSLEQVYAEERQHRQSYGRDDYGFRGRNLQASCRGYEPVNMEKLRKIHDLI